MRFVALVVAALIATAHAQVTIEYWHINSATFGAKAVTQAVAAFEAEHPGIRVIERFQEGSYGGLLTNLQAAIAAGRPPAVAQIGYNFRLFAFNELPHVPIDTFSDRGDYADFVDTFIPGMLRLGTDENGVLRAVPFAVSVPMLYYNADLFREAGLDPAGCAVLPLTLEVPADAPESSLDPAFSITWVLRVEAWSFPWHLKAAFPLPVFDASPAQIEWRGSQRWVSNR